MRDAAGAQVAADLKSRVLDGFHHGLFLLSPGRLSLRAVSFLLVQFIVCIFCEFMNWDIHGKHVRAVLLIHLWKVNITEDMGMESVGLGFMF